MSLKIMSVGDRNIIVKGVAKLYYQDGFTLSMSKDILKENGFELSWLHVADELYKHGWSEKRCLSTLRNEIDDDTTYNLCVKFIKVAKGTKTLLYTGSGYEDQRAMLFNYLFESKDVAVECLKPICNNFVK